MKLKTVKVMVNNVETEFAAILNGQPVFIGDDGKETAIDVPHTVTTIARVQGEAKTNRERAEAAEAKLEAFKDLDPAAARKALATVKNLDDKKLVDAGEVEKVKAEAIKAVEEKYAPIVSENAKLKENFFNAQVSGNFSRSKLLTDPKHPLSLVIPADIAEKAFGKNFTLDEKTGKLTAKYDNGNPIYSKTKPGEIAEFDEAFELLVDAYPNKDQIVRSSGHRGDGAGHGSNGSGGGKRVMTRAEFDKMDPVQQRAAASGKDAVTIVD